MSVLVHIIVFSCEVLAQSGYYQYLCGKPRKSDIEAAMTFTERIRTGRYAASFFYVGFSFARISLHILGTCLLAHSLAMRPKGE